MNFAKEATAQAHNLTPADTEAIERVLRQVDADPEGYMQWKYSFEIRPTPSEYDVVLTDITEKTLKDIHFLTNGDDDKYLSKGTFPSPMFPVEGTICGHTHRPMVCLNCKFEPSPDAPILKIWFVVDTASPYTYLEERACTALANRSDLPLYRMNIQTPNMCLDCYKSHGNFKNVNVLGMDVLMKLKVSPEMNTQRKIFRLVDQKNA